jgi:virginiamycin B lyase
MPWSPRLPWRFAAVTLLLSAAPTLQAQFAVSRGIGQSTRPDRPAAWSGTTLPGRGVPGMLEPQPAFRPLPSPFPTRPDSLGWLVSVPADHGEPTAAEAIRRRLGPGADWPGANLAGLDLRRMDLTGAVLKDGSLARADARGATFTRCDLSGVDFTGARIRGARFFLADVCHSSGLDLTGAELHPFWAVDPDEPVGRVKHLILDDGEGAAPLRVVVSSPDRSLFWLDGQRAHICGIAPTGALRTFGWGAGGTLDQVQALAPDGAGRLWVLGREWIGRIDLNRMGACFGAFHGPKSEFQYRMPAVPSEPALVVAKPDGDVHFFLAGALEKLVLGRSGGKRTLTNLSMPMGGVVPMALVGLPGKDELAFIDAAANQIVTAIQNRKYCQKHLQLTDRKAVGLALGPDGNLWSTLVSQDPHRPDQILRIPVAGGGFGFHALPAVPGGGPRGLGAIAAGPDGHLWFVEADAGRIGRISLAGDLTYFPLPPGTRPRNLFPGHDGRMFFTEETGGRLGSIRALARPAETTFQPCPSSEAKASWRVEPYAPRPEVKIRKAAPQPVASSPAPEPLPDPAPGLETKQPVPAPSPTLATPPPPRPRAALPGLPPHARLAALGITLPYASLGHILTEHGHGYTGRKGAFAPEFSSIIALEQLLADGLEQAGGVAAVWRADGRSVTLCARPGVGVWRAADGTASGASDRFLVVAESTLEDDGTRSHRIVTAYPVR